MAHDLSIRADGTAEMAYVGETPWHGLGQALTPGSDIDVWTKAAGLDWAVNESMVEFTIDGAIQSFDARKVLYRSDTKTPLSVVSDSYKTVQPATILDFFREVTSKTDAQMETRAKMSASRKGYVFSEESRKKIGDGNRGKVRSDELRQRIRASVLKTLAQKKFINQSEGE